MVSPEVYHMVYQFVPLLVYFGDFMAVVSVKVPEWVREKMKAYNKVVDWPEEIRRSIIARIEEVERVRAVDEAVKLLKGVTPAPRGTARTLVREDRDRH